MSEWREMAAADVLTLGMAADDMRRKMLPSGVVTYLREHSLSPGDLSGALTIPDAASELRLYETPADFDLAVAQVRQLRRAAGTRRVVAYSIADILERSWTSRADAAVQALVEAGLDDVAEVPVDRLQDPAGAIRLLRAGGIEPTRLTVAEPLGARRLEIIPVVQRILDEHACLRRFAPLPRRAAADKPTTGYDDVRMVAVSRLAFRACSIEVDWTLYGPKLAQVALTFGADHLDAVAAADDATLGRRRTTVEDVARNIRAAGFEPQEYRPAPRSLAAASDPDSTASKSPGGSESGRVR